MKYIKNKHNIRINRLVLKFIAITIILSGLCFASVSIIKYAKGYFAYHTENSENKAYVTDKRPDENRKDESLLTREELELKNIKAAIYPEHLNEGDKIGELYIQKLNATLPIYQGTDDKELDQGVGHYINSVLPGEEDNCVLSGHRDTVFRKLGDVGIGDQLIVTTSAGEFTYRVNKVRIVSADDRTVIVPRPRAVLTVSTCYPFEYIGSAPKRYILVAYLASEKLYQ